MLGLKKHMFVKNGMDRISFLGGSTLCMVGTRGFTGLLPKNKTCQQSNLGIAHAHVLLMHKGLNLDLWFEICCR